ncbi:MAG: DUF3574 domain-containing protein [Stellaceae bacterium]
MAGFAVALAGCAAAPSPPQASASAPRHPYVCLLPGEQRMLVAELFFGRMSHGRLAVSDAEWADFLGRTVTPNFPDGLTVFDGYGQWRDPQTRAIGRAHGVKIVLIAAKRQPDLAGRLTAVIDAYKARFRQRSVGVITRDSCAGFGESRAGRPG